MMGIIIISKQSNLGFNFMERKHAVNKDRNIHANQPEVKNG